MTGILAFPANESNIKVLYKLASEIQYISGISRVLYNLTSKPLGMTEWE